MAEALDACSRSVRWIIANMIVAQDVSSKSDETPAEAPCYIVCKSGCRIRQDSVSAAGHTDYYAEQGTNSWKRLFGDDSHALIDRLHELHSDATCPPADRTNEEKCVIALHLSGEGGRHQVEIGSPLHRRAIRKEQSLVKARGYIKALIAAGQCSPAFPDSDSSAEGWAR